MLQLSVCGCGCQWLAGFCLLLREPPPPTVCPPVHGKAALCPLCCPGSTLCCDHGRGGQRREVLPVRVPVSCGQGFISGQRRTRLLAHWVDVRPRSRSTLYPCRQSVNRSAVRPRPRRDRAACVLTMPVSFLVTRCVLDVPCVPHRHGGDPVLSQLPAWGCAGVATCVRVPRVASPLFRGCSLLSAGAGLTIANGAPREFSARARSSLPAIGAGNPHHGHTVPEVFLVSPVCVSLC